MRSLSTCLLPLFLAAGAQAAPPAPSAGGFAGDPRLQTPVTLACKDRPLGEVIGDLSKQLGMKLAAARETRDDRITLFVERRPARTLLARIAAHLDFIWLPQGAGYELAQSVAARRREQDRRLADLAPIRREMEQTAALLAQPRQQLLDRVKEIDALIESGKVPAAERPARAREKQLLLNVALSQPGVPKTTVELFRSLEEPQVAQLLDGDQLRLSTANQTLPEALARLVEGATTPVLERQAEVVAPQRQAEVVVWLAEGDGSHEFGPEPREDRSLGLRFAYNSMRGEGVNYSIVSARWNARGPGPAVEPEKAPDDPFFKRRVDLRFPGPEKSLPPFLGPGPREGRRALEYVWPAWPTLGDLAAALHRDAQVEVVSDSFVSVRFDPAALRGSRSVGEVLEFLGRESDYTWRREGNLLLLRSRRFYRDRPAEVPERILKPWRQRIEVKPSLELDDLAELAGALTNPQARSMQDYWGWYLEGARIAPPDWFYGNRQHLRLWNALTPAQRRTARAGVLPVSALNPAQRQAWTAALFAPPVTIATPTDLRRAPREAELAAGGFSLKVEDVQEQLFSMVVPDGSRRVSNSIVAPAGADIRRLGVRGEDSPAPDGPPTPLTSFGFQYHLAGEMKPARTVDVSLPKAGTRPGG